MHRRCLEAQHITKGHSRFWSQQPMHNFEQQLNTITSNTSMSHKCAFDSLYTSIKQNQQLLHSKRLQDQQIGLTLQIKERLRCTSAAAVCAASANVPQVYRLPLAMNFCRQREEQEVTCGKVVQGSAKVGVLDVDHALTDACETSCERMDAIKQDTGQHPACGHAPSGVATRPKEDAFQS